MTPNAIAAISHPSLPDEFEIRVDKLGLFLIDEITRAKLKSQFQEGCKKLIAEGFEIWQTIDPATGDKIAHFKRR